jgi:hypothetical protein
MNSDVYDWARFVLWTEILAGHLKERDHLGDIVVDTEDMKVI